ncbi:MAG: DUF4347 domain-containing protein [Fuerstiella sp.]|nr:DUF4347 domain-containing protein [Fuerstiella sp.]
MEITVIDNSDWVGMVVAASRIGEVTMTNVASMVRNVLNRANGRSISRLNIVDHGNSQSFQIGNDRISQQTLGRFRPTLARLNSHFTATGFVHLQHCRIGNNQSLLLELSRIWGVPVYAGTGDHNSLYRFNFGEYVRCEPQAVACQTNVRRPGLPAPTTVEPRYMGRGAFMGRDGIIRQGAGPKL